MSCSASTFSPARSPRPPAPSSPARRRAPRRDDHMRYFDPMDGSFGGGGVLGLSAVLPPLKTDLTASHARTAPSLMPWPNWTAPFLISSPGSEAGGGLSAADAAASDVPQTSRARAAALTMERMHPLFPPINPRRVNRPRARDPRLNL